MKLLCTLFATFFMSNFFSRSEHDAYVPATEIGLGRDTIRHFTRTYKEMNAYVISQVPMPMEKDIAIPPCLQCGNFARSIQEVHLFITAKGGQTLLHRDPFSNIHCVFNGTKDWILLDNSNDQLLYQSKESKDEFGGFSLINVNRVDLNRFPKIRDVRYSRVTLNRGDCIFMPASYWHQVRVNGEYNTAVSIWFTRDVKAIPQDWNDCAGKVFDFKPMSEVDVLWRFSGKNESLNQGRMDVFVMKAVLLSLADDNGVIAIHRFCEMIDVSAAKNYRVGEVCEKFMQQMGKGSDTIRASDVNALSVEQLKSLLIIINPNDESNTPTYEYSYVTADDVGKTFRKVLRGEKDSLSFDEFVHEYTVTVGGTKNVAHKIFKQLDDENAGVVNKNNLHRNLKTVLTWFASAPRHDPRTERMWMRRLRERDEL